MLETTTSTKNINLENAFDIPYEKGEHGSELKKHSSIMKNSKDQKKGKKMNTGTHNVQGRKTQMG